MKTLVIAPHLDDESISCGGLIHQRVREGGEVSVVALFGRKYNYGKGPQESEDEFADFEAAQRILGFQRRWWFGMEEGEPHKVGYYSILEKLEVVLNDVKPDEVIGPAGDDLNQDHRMLHHAVGIALRPINLGRVVRVLDFFALDGSVRQPSFYVPLPKLVVDVKLAAIAAYRREARTGTSPRAPDNVVAQMKVWGAACGSSFAEAYRLRFARESNEGSDNG